MSTTGLLLFFCVIGAGYAQLASSWAHPTQPATAPTKRFAQAMWTIPNATTSSDVFIHGGYASGGSVSAEVWHYSVALNTWTAVTNASVRAFQQTAWTPLGLVIEGGVITTGPNVLLNRIDVIVWDPAHFVFAANGNNWVPTVPPPRLVGQSMSYVGGALYLFGGFPCEPSPPGCNHENRIPVTPYFGPHTDDFKAATNISFDPTNGFSFDKDLTPPAFAYAYYGNDAFGYGFHTATVAGTDIWILGGQTTNFYGDHEVASYADNLAYSVQKYNTSSNSWSYFTPVFNFARWGHAAALFGNQIYIFGGRDQADVYRNDLLSLDIGTVQFTIHNSGSAPQARMFHSMAVVQSTYGCHQLMVYGGTQNTGFTSNQAPTYVSSSFSAAANDADAFTDVSLLTLSLPTVTQFDGCIPVFPNITNCPAAGHVSITIIGTNLDTAGLQVTVQGTSCDILSQTPTHLVCKTPASSVKVPQVLITACSSTVDVTGFMSFAVELPLTPIASSWAGFIAIGSVPSRGFGGVLWTQPDGTASDVVFQYGGYTLTAGIAVGEVWRYSISANAWTLVTTTNVRAFHTAQWTPIGLVIEGGVINSGPNILTNQIDVVLWDPVNFVYATNGSNFIPTTPPTRLVGHTMSYVQGALYIFGGYGCATSPPGCNHEDSVVLSPADGAADEFIAATNISLNPAHGLSFDQNLTPPQTSYGAQFGRAYHTATVDDTDIWILGGLTEDFLGEVRVAGQLGDGDYSVQKYDTLSGIWSNFVTVMPFARWGHAATLFDNQIYVFGGRDVGGGYLNDLLTLDMVTVQFTSHSVGSPPTALAFRPMILVQPLTSCYRLMVKGGTSYSGFSAGQPSPLVPSVFDTAASSATNGDRKQYFLSLLPIVTSFLGCTPVFPNVTDCYPTGNIPLTIIGKRLSASGLAITVGGVNCPLTSQSDTQVVCLLPPSSGPRVPQILMTGCQDSTFLLDLTGAVTYALPCAPFIVPTPRFGQIMWTAPNASTVPTSSLFVYGGVTPTGPLALSQEVWNYNILTQCWTQMQSDYVTVSGHPARAFMAGAHTPTGFVINGGGTSDANNVVTDQIDVVTWMPFQYDTSHINVPLLVNPPPALFGHTLTYFEGGLYIIGGWPCVTNAPCNGVTNRPQINIYEATNLTLFDFGATPVAITPTTASTVGFHTATVLNDTIYIFGGVDAGSFSAVSGGLSAFKPATLTFTILLPASNNPRLWGHSANAFNDNIYIFGGRLSGGAEPYQNSLYVLDAGRTNTVRLLGLVLTPRAYHSTVLMQFQSCSAIMVYGGTNDDTSIRSVNQNTERLLSNMLAETIAPFTGVDVIYIGNAPNVTYVTGCTPVYPNVTNCLPSGNVPLTIVGHNLGSPTLQITLAAASCVVTSQSDTQVVCLLPAVSVTVPQFLLTACGQQVDLTGSVVYAAVCSATVVPDPRMGAVMWTTPDTSVVSDSIFVYGGVTPAGPQTPSQEVWHYNLTSGCWNQLRSDYVTVPGGGYPGRAFASGAHTPSGFVIFGGGTGDSLNIMTNQLDVITWMPLQFNLVRPNVPLLVNPPNALFGHTLTYFNGSLFIIGGWPCLVPSSCQTMASFPEDNINRATNFTDFDFGATPFANFPTAATTVGFHTATLLNSTIYIYGGVAALSFNQVSAQLTAFDPSTGTVTPLAVSAFTLWGHSAQAHNNKLYIFGGRRHQSFELYQNTLFVVDVGRTNTFTLLSQPLTPRAYHSMVLSQFLPACYALVIYGGTNDVNMFVSARQAQNSLLPLMMSETVMPFPEVDVLLLDPATITSSAGCVTVGAAATECPHDGNVTLTITGANLGAPSTAIFVGSAECPIILQNNTVIECTLPPFNGTYNPIVTLQSCNAAVQYSNVVGYVPAPVPDRCSPNPCQFNGTCENDPTVDRGYNCTCLFDLTGVNCTEPVQALFTQSDCQNTVDCACFGQANGTTSSVVISGGIAVTCGFTATGVPNGSKCMGGKCLCAPGWWNVDAVTSGTIFAECGFQVANASIPGGSNLYSPVHVGVSYYWNEYMPQICGCNDFSSFTEGNIEGNTAPVCTAGQACFPGCTTFFGCFGSGSAAAARVGNCRALSSSPTCNANQLPATNAGSGSTVFPAVQQDQAYQLAAAYGAPNQNCSISQAQGAELFNGNPPFCYCKPGFCTLNCCPCDVKTLTPCGGVGFCHKTGVCTCPPGTGGTYCCPIGNNGTACGPYGTCLPDGTCACTRDFLGNACQNIDTRCPTADPNFSCSGIGTCVQQPSFNSCLAILNYIDNPSIQLAQFSPPITDEGIWNLVVDLWLAFKFIDISQSTDRTLFNPYLTACQGNVNEAACVLSLWVANANNTDLAIDGGGFRRNIAGYVLDVFATFHPELAGISGGFLATVIPLINATFHNPSSLFQGEAALLCYPQYINWLDQSLTATFPTYPLSNCQCTTTTTGTIGATMLPAGPDCASSCPLGNNGVVCSGFFEGQFAGVCSPSDGADVCICDTRFAGNACQFDLIGECYPQFSQNTQACTASSHGNCFLTNPLAQNQVYACNCSSTWRGTFCEFSRCAPNNQDQTTECSGNGICEPSLTCSCDITRFLGGCHSSSFPALSQCTGAQLCLPIGSQCEQNGIAQCGVFTPDPGSCGSGQGFWSSCSGHGTCTAQTSPQLPFCACDPGYNGDVCQFSICSPSCNSHSTCNTGNGQCVCHTMWSSPGGCTNSSQPCFCSQNLCVHGEPDVNGTNCDCDAGWAKDGSGHCTIVQCPFIVETNQGEIPCLQATPFCPNTNGLIPQNQQFSLDHGCCINTCPTCQLNTTTGVRTCICTNNIQYVQSGGICFSVCHGQPSSIVGQSVVCDCSGLTVQPNQFIDSFCELFTCLNGGTPDGTGGCTCTGAFTGQFCATPNCGTHGQPNLNNTGCDCFLPYTHSPPSSPLCLGDDCGPGGSVQVIGPQQFQCSCASNTLIGPLSLSCETLNCTLPAQQGSCALCLHGSAPYITANQIACNCSGTGYTGIQCSVLVCLNGGTVVTVNNQQSCQCVVPWTGSVCQTSQCQHGGQPGNGVCVCPPAYTGTFCQLNATISSTASSSSTASHSSSSSSTAARSSSSSSGARSSSSSSTARLSSSSSSSSTGVASTLSSTAAASNDTTESSSTADNTTSSSSSTALEAAAPAAASGLTTAQWYGAVVGGTVGGVIVVGGVLTIVAWQLGWGAFGATAAASTAASSSSAAAAAGSAAVGAVGGRAYITDEERFPLMSVRRH